MVQLVLKALLVQPAQRALKVLKVYRVLPVPLVLPVLRVPPEQVEEPSMQRMILVVLVLADK
jgi:hypothetical protein